MVVKRLCKVCRRPIPRGRTLALPDADTCADHSEAVARSMDDAGLVDSEDIHDLLMSMQSGTRADRWD